MTSDFPAQVQNIVGPLLADLGFTLDEIDNNVDEGGRRASVVYYQSKDCRIQIYKSSREGNVNSMIAPLDAPNEYGLRGKADKWQYLARFAQRPNLSLEELVQSVESEFKSDSEELEQVKDDIAKHFKAAHAGVLEMYRNR